MNLLKRVQDILLNPKGTWTAIADESGDVKTLYA